MSEVVIKVQNTTPLLTGWYEPDLVDPVGLRPTEIKGLWRWWARAFVGGVLYDLGHLKGQPTPNIYLRPSKDEVSIISRIVGQNLGLGYASGRFSSSASRFKIYVEKDVSKQLVKGDMYSRYMRIKLLMRKTRAEERKGERTKEEIKVIPPGASFKIHIKAPPNFPLADTALKILIIGLQIMGVGKGSRRGLGSLDLLSIEGFNVENKLPKVIEETYSEVKEIVEKELGELREQKTLYRVPPLPVVSRGKVEDVSVTRIYHISKLTSYEKIHNFFVRSTRTSVLGQDTLMLKQEAWVLGLPRGVVRKGKEVTRRASPFTMSFHKEQNFFGQGAYVAVFLSGDWPTKIAWYQGPQGQQTEGQKTKKENDTSIVEALKVAVDEFITYTKRVTGNEPNLIWPTQSR
ncbi:type III-B CRISPR module RAMP protein Cmr1 [Desulfurococcus amylolyticus]|uniref:type III-B CRISPR module RAMP protein Cmr1 n=1 Tax=Desulfurococcus amylolyticus TaxID=94694 RepID=UPI0003253B27|nr:type III-B CRISPR module RAMP protein Cmr1 [Desulfurococcus amylolyticus]